MYYREMLQEDIPIVTKMYVETFNSPPWNDVWTEETAGKRLMQMISCEEAYGLLAYEDYLLCGMALGCTEQFITETMFDLKEFCVRNDMRSHGIGSLLLEELERRLKGMGVGSICLFTSGGKGIDVFYQKRGYETYSEMVMMGKKLN